MNHLAYEFDGSCLALLGANDSLILRNPIHRGPAIGGVRFHLRKAGCINPQVLLFGGKERDLRRGN